MDHITSEQFNYTRVYTGNNHIHNTSTICQRGSLAAHKLSIQIFLGNTSIRILPSQKMFRENSKSRTIPLRGQLAADLRKTPGPLAFLAVRPLHYLIKYAKPSTLSHPMPGTATSGHTPPPLHGHSTMPLLPCIAKRQYLLTLQVSRYCLLALQRILPEECRGWWEFCILVTPSTINNESTFVIDVGLMLIQCYFIYQEMDT